MKRYLLSFIAAFALVGTASAAAPGPADVEAIVNNLGPTVEALADGLSNTVNNMITTTTANGQPSAVQTSADLGTTLINTGNALISGSPTLGAAGLLLSFGNGGIQGTLSPYLTAIDDPTSANIQAALAPGDLNTIMDNLQDVPYATIEGNGPASSPAPYGNGLRAAGISLLQGQISTLGNQGVVTDSLLGVILPIATLTTGTNLQPANTLLGLGVLGVTIVANDQLQQLDGPATQLADAGAPLTAPVIGILKKGF